MATLPLAAELNGETITEAGFRTAIGSLRDYLFNLFGNSDIGADVLLNLGVTSPVLLKTTAYTIVATDINKIIDVAGASNIVVTLPRVTTIPTEFRVSVRNSGTSTVTLTPSTSSGQEYINGLTTYVLSPGDAVSIYCDISSMANAWKVSSSIGSSNVKVGYNTGGQIPQVTGRTTGVTLHALSGAITLVAAILNAGVVSSFILTNNKIEANDIVIVHRKSGGTDEKYNIWVDSVSAGSCKISIRNFTATNSASESPVIAFTVIKGAVA